MALEIELLLWSEIHFLCVLYLHKHQCGILLFFMPISFLFQLIKYGIISTSVLIEDLLNWNNLYIAGRLQKPVSECFIRDVSPLWTSPYFDLCDCNDVEMSFTLLSLPTEFVARQYPDITHTAPSLSRFSSCLNGSGSESVRLAGEDGRRGVQCLGGASVGLPRSPPLLECKCHGALFVQWFVPTVPGTMPGM